MCVNRFTTCLALTLCLPLLAATSLTAQDVPSQNTAERQPTNPDMIGNQTPQQFRYKAVEKQELNYLLYLPKAYDADRESGWPLMLFLHGAGERGNDLARVKIHGPPKLVETDPDFPFVLVSPQCPEDQTWDTSALSRLLDDVTARLNIDTDRVYLTGLSMGGYGTWNLGIAEPQRFAAIAPICGGGELLDILLVPAAQRAALQNLPVWAFHGGEDTVVPVDESQRMVAGLKRLGSKNVKLTIYPDAGHNSWTQTYDNPEFFTWLLQHKRDGQAANE